MNKNYNSSRSPTNRQNIKSPKNEIKYDNGTSKNQLILFKIEVQNLQPKSNIKMPNKMYNNSFESSAVSSKSVLTQGKKAVNDDINGKQIYVNIYSSQ